MEESLDFTGEDTGERPGAVRLRKVQQKTRCYIVDKLKMCPSRGYHTRERSEVLQTLSEARQMSLCAPPILITNVARGPWQ